MIKMANVKCVILGNTHKLPKVPTSEQEAIQMVHCLYPQLRNCWLLIQNDRHEPFDFKTLNPSHPIKFFVKKLEPRSLNQSCFDYSQIDQLQFTRAIPSIQYSSSVKSLSSSSSSSSQPSSIIATLPPPIKEELSATVHRLKSKLSTQVNQLGGLTKGEKYKWRITLVNNGSSPWPSTTRIYELNSDRSWPAAQLSQDEQLTKILELEANRHNSLIEFKCGVPTGKKEQPVAFFGSKICHITNLRQKSLDSLNELMNKTGISCSESVWRKPRK